MDEFLEYDEDFEDEALTQPPHAGRPTAGDPLVANNVDVSPAILSPRSAAQGVVLNATRDGMLRAASFRSGKASDSASTGRVGLDTLTAASPRDVRAVAQLHASAREDAGTARRTANEALPMQMVAPHMPQQQQLQANRIDRDSPHGYGSAREPDAESGRRSGPPARTPSGLALMAAPVQPRQVVPHAAPVVPDASGALRAFAQPQAPVRSHDVAAPRSSAPPAAHGALPVMSATTHAPQMARHEPVRMMAATAGPVAQMLVAGRPSAGPSPYAQPLARSHAHASVAGSPKRVRTRPSASRPHPQPDDPQPAVVGGIEADQDAAVAEVEHEDVPTDGSADAASRAAAIARHAQTSAMLQARDRTIKGLRSKIDSLSKALADARRRQGASSASDQLADLENARRERDVIIQRLQEELRTLTAANRTLSKQLDLVADSDTSSAKLDAVVNELRAEKERVRRLKEAEQRAQEQVRRQNEMIAALTEANRALRKQLEDAKLAVEEATAAAEAAAQHHAAHSSSPSARGRAHASGYAATHAARLDATRRPGAGHTTGRAVPLGAVSTAAAGRAAAAASAWANERKLLLAKLASAESRLAAQRAAAADPHTVATMTAENKSLKEAAATASQSLQKKEREIASLKDMVVHLQRQVMAMRYDRGRGESQSPILSQSRRTDADDTSPARANKTQARTSRSPAKPSATNRTKATSVPNTDTPQRGRARERSAVAAQRGAHAPRDDSRTRASPTKIPVPVAAAQASASSSASPTHKARSSGLRSGLVPDAPVDDQVEAIFAAAPPIEPALQAGLNPQQLPREIERTPSPGVFELTAITSHTVPSVLAPAAAVTAPASDPRLPRDAPVVAPLLSVRSSDRLPLTSSRSPDHSSQSPASTMQPSARNAQPPFVRTASTANADAAAAPAEEVPDVPLTPPTASTRGQTASTGNAPDEYEDDAFDESEQDPSEKLEPVATVTQQQVVEASTAAPAQPKQEQPTAQVPTSLESDDYDADFADDDDDPQGTVTAPSGSKPAALLSPPAPETKTVMPSLPLIQSSRSIGGQTNAAVSHSARSDGRGAAALPTGGRATVPDDPFSSILSAAPVPASNTLARPAFGGGTKKPRDLFN